MAIVGRHRLAYWCKKLVVLCSRSRPQGFDEYMHHLEILVRASNSSPKCVLSNGTLSRSDKKSLRFSFVRRPTFPGCSYMSIRLVFEFGGARLAIPLHKRKT